MEIKILHQVLKILPFYAVQSNKIPVKVEFQNIQVHACQAMVLISTTVNTHYKKEF